MHRTSVVMSRGEVRPLRGLCLPTTLQSTCLVDGKRTVGYAGAELGTEEELAQEGKRMTQEVKAETVLPLYTEEEDKGLHIANDHKCYACRAIVHQLRVALDEKDRHRGGRRLKEWEYTEVMEAVCDNTKAWEKYGTKQYLKKNVLQGPGLPGLEEPMISDGPMVMMSGTKYGGFWSHRLTQRCRGLLGEIGEDEFYKMHNSSSEEGLFVEACRAACRDETLPLDFLKIHEEEQKVEDESMPVKQEKPKKKKKKSKTKSATKQKEDL